MRKFLLLTACATAVVAILGLTGFMLGRAFAVRQPVAVSTSTPVAEREDKHTGSIFLPQLATPAPASPALAPAAISTDYTSPGTAAVTSARGQRCNNQEALGVARVVEIDATGGPGFGFEHFKAYDFLRDGEVVLTFDDGPWPGNTPAVLRALADQCAKALFFPIGKHAIWHPEILKQVAAEGHTIGSHTWSHADLSKLDFDQAKTEFEKGASAVRAAMGTAEAPFFRFPGLRHPREMVTYLGTRDVAVFSTDMDSFDFKKRKPEQVIVSVMTQLKKHGKGIVLLHDFQHATSLALPELLVQLKAGGYKIVQVSAKQSLKTLPEYDDVITNEFGGNAIGSRPISSVVRTVSQ